MATDSVRRSALGPTIADLSLLSLSRRPYWIGGVSRSRPGGSGAGVGEQAFYGLADLVQQPAGVSSLPRSSSASLASPQGAFSASSRSSTHWRISADGSTPSASATCRSLASR